MTEQNDGDVSSPSAVEAEARKQVDFLWGLHFAMLEKEKKLISPELYEFYSKPLKGLLSTFQEFSSSIDPLRREHPAIVGEIFRLMSQAISEAVVVGGIVAVTPIVREHYQHPAKQEKREAGKASGLARRKARKWIEHATSLAKQIRERDTKISQERLAEEIIFSWKLDSLPPSMSTLKKFISDLERQGELQSRTK